MEGELEPIYVDLASESDDPKVTILSSLCIQCHSMGTTRLLMTRIPHYKEVVLSSFECDNCGNRNTSCQPGQWQDEGVCFRLQVKKEEDLGRQVVKSDVATVTVPELELEIPPNGEKGEITTVEGILTRTLEGLSCDQPTRRIEDPDTAMRIDTFMNEIRSLLIPGNPFTLIVDDPSGNSFVENPHAPNKDPQLKRTQYQRTKEQNSALGIVTDEIPAAENKDVSNESNLQSSGQEEGESSTTEEAKDDSENIKDEVLVFTTLCNNCCRPVNTNMKVTKIPHFKEVIIMAVHCESCGYRSNEVKSGSGVSKCGRRITLQVKEPYDLARDVLKSETCELSIPELDLVVGGGLIGGKFTTLEGLLLNIKEDLLANPFLMGDSQNNEERKAAMDKLLAGLDEVIEGKREITFIMDDPAGNNYLQNLYAPDDDPQLVVEEYERTYEQNEDLGLNDMKTENYEVEGTVNTP